MFLQIGLKPLDMLLDDDILNYTIYLVPLFLNIS